MNKELKKQIEKDRILWGKVAKENGWFKNPFFIQVWINKKGEVEDSVSFKGITKDILIYEK